MKFVLEIKVDIDASTEKWRREVKAILKEAIWRVETGHDCLPLCDNKGRPVGQMMVAINP